MIIVGRNWLVRRAGVHPNNNDFEDIMVEEVENRLSAREGSIGRSINMIRPR